MKVIAFITEYNPFHNGHKYHLERSLALTNATHTIAVMSGSFVQRGEPSFVDKWTKAKMAIENGIDLVIELPFIYSCQSAELFAYGAINIINSLNVVKNISFGSESNNIDILSEIAKVLLEEPIEFKEILKKYLSQGLSFPKSRSLAIKDYFENILLQDFNNYENILKQSNNILAIEYLKALYILNSDIQPITIKRLGPDYKEKEITKGFASATGIRNHILKGGIHSIKNYVPQPSYKLLKEYKDKYKNFNSIENYDRIINYLIITSKNDKLKSLLDVDRGLANRIKQQGEKYNDIRALIDKISTKRYPKTRIQRILMHLLNDLNKNTIKELYKAQAPYIRILGSNKKGFEILREIKEKSDIPIINRFSDYKKYNNPVIDKFIYYEEKATDIYFMGLNLDIPLVKMDYKTSQYIK